MRRALHLVTRFFGALSPRPLDSADASWVAGLLSARELELWLRLDRADQKHAAGVARRADAVFGGQTDRDVLAAALLHDVGKVDAGLGTFGRVAATVVTVACTRERVVGWSAAGGWRGRIGRYADHPDRGAALTAEAGAPELVVRWTREHHLPPAQVSVDASVADVLREVDDD